MPRIFRVAKKQWRQYGGMPNRLVVSDWDTEKQSYEDEWVSESASSSRSSSGSYYSQDAMLDSTKRHKGPSKAYEANKEPQRKCNKYFTVVVGILLITFVVTLYQLHLSSQRDVYKGFSAVSREQPWDRFKELERYYGGLRSLTPNQDWTPEFPADRETLIESLNNITRAEDASEDNLARRATIPNSQPWAVNTDRRPIAKADGSFAEIPQLRAYDGRPQGFPRHAIGSYEIFGLDDKVCFDRFGRLGPYGLGYSQKRGGTGAGLEGDRDGAEEVWTDTAPVNFEQVRWHDARSRCSRESGQEVDSAPRSVVLIRTSADLEFNREDVLFLRAVTSELVLDTDCTFDVHFLVQVRDEDVQIWSNEESYRTILEQSLPAEFQGMGTLWSERQMSLIYGGPDSGEGENGARVEAKLRRTYMPVQHFSQQHPEYESIWNWEMDARYVGHLGDLLKRLGEWSATQPRKELWERNARFYVPGEHGSWEDFKQMVRVQTQHGSATPPGSFAGAAGAGGEASASHAARKSVWGAERPAWDEIVAASDQDSAPTAPCRAEDDAYEWGVGEAADLITLSPIFDPAGTLFPQGTDVTGYNVTHFQQPPLRAAIGSTVRLSRRLLSTMHRETALGRRSMAHELWAPSVALHHGYKAVYAPLPAYVEKQWPVDYLAAVLNRGRDGASGGARSSVFSAERRAAGVSQEEALRSALAGTTWHTHGSFAARLWRRWLGYKSEGQGGEEHELAEEGRMCLPPMLLHPVKGVKLIYQDRG